MLELGGDGIAEPLAAAEYYAPCNGVREERFLVEIGYNVSTGLLMRGLASVGQRGRHPAPGGRAHRAVTGRLAEIL